MGGLVVSHYCCIHESVFKDKGERKENIETVEQEAMKLGGVAIERATSFIGEFSPSRKSSKSRNDD